MQDTSCYNQNMKLTKYQHACFTLEKDSKLLVVDPGELSRDYRPSTGVVVVVITHEHFDHLSLPILSAIIALNPDVKIFTPRSVASKIDLQANCVEIVSPGDDMSIGGFKLVFGGGLHASIHTEFHAPFENITLLVDDRIYYPGDSLVQPDESLDVLLLPISAPWMKISESMDFLTRIKPRVAIPTHDGILSTDGIAVYDNWYKLAASKIGADYIRLTESIEI